MTLKEYREEFKSTFNWEDSLTIGKIDNNKDKAVCFYNSKRTLSPIKAIDNNSYKIKPITILLRYTTNQDTAEQMANSIYEFYDDRAFFIGKKRIAAQHIYSEPVNLGTDDSGVYEYSLEINFLEER